MSLYKVASKMKLRFATSKGNLSVEDLWDLNLVTLDKIAVALDAEVSKGSKKSFITEASTEDEVLTLKLDILKDIIHTKLDEKKKREEAKDKLSKKNKLMELIAKKEESDLEKLSVDELRQKLSELN